MRCDRNCKQVKGMTVLEVEVYNTAGTDSENRELCLSCIWIAKENGHEVSFLCDDDEELYKEYERMLVFLEEFNDYCEGKESREMVGELV